MAKKRFDVTFYYHTNLTVSVEAENEKEALAIAEGEAEKECYTKDLLDGLQEDGSPDVVEDDDYEDDFGNYVNEIEGKVS